MKRTIWSNIRAGDLGRWRCVTVLVWLALAACSTQTDPIVGTWKAGDKTFEFTDDGTVIGAARSEPSCADDRQAVAECARRHQWKRTGSTVQITFMTLAPPGISGVPFGGLFASENNATGCSCVEDIRAQAEVIGDELVIEPGKERARRVQ